MTIETQDEKNWQKPIPLTEEMQSQYPYPVECLPALIRNAVVDYQQYGQQPLPLIACSALANVSLACQALANVARDKLLISPVSLYFLVVAESGERKTAADQMFGKAIRAWESQKRETLMPNVQAAQTLHHVWQIEKKGILTQIRRVASGETGDILFLKQRLLEVSASEPTLPLLPMLYFEDATQEALVSHLANGWPSASLWSDEGGIIFAGHGMQNNTTKFVAMLNRLWEGKSFITHRKTSSNFMVSHRRLTVSIMLQPLLMRQMLTKNGGVSRQSGFLARSLMTYPDSAMGERYYLEPPQHLATLPCFHQRLMECLEDSLTLDTQGCHDLPTLFFSTKAKARWIEFFNQVESGLQKSSHWSSIKDFASKSAENAARLAALFHLFEGKVGDINTESTEQAIQLIHWHLQETRRLLGHHLQVSSRSAEALKLWEWIKGKSLLNITLRHLQQYSPIREKPSLIKAIHTLIENNYLRETKLNKRSVFWVNPHN